MSRFPNYAVAIVPAVEVAHTVEPYKSLCKAMAWCNAFNHGAVEQVAVLIPWCSVDPVLRRLPGATTTTVVIRNDVTNEEETVKSSLPLAAIVAEVEKRINFLQDREGGILHLVAQSDPSANAITLTWYSVREPDFAKSIVEEGDVASRMTAWLLGGRALA